jgi:hypothetical protein
MMAHPTSTGDNRLKGVDIMVAAGGIYLHV